MATVTLAEAKANLEELVSNLAQALTENIPIISSDAELDAYGVARIW